MYNSNKIDTISKTIETNKALLNDRVLKLEVLKKDLEALKVKVDLYQKTLDFLNRFASDSRNAVTSKIEELVSNVMHKVLKSDRFDFKVVFSQKRGSVDANYCIWDNDNKTEVDIINASGGGVADTISTILFFTFLHIFNPSSDFIIFDEVGKAISADKRGEFFSFLKDLSVQYGKQLIYVSHQAEILDYADNVVKL